MPNTRGGARKSASKAPAASPAKVAARGNIRKTAVEVASTKSPGRAGSGRKTGAPAVAALAQTATRAEELTEDEVLADSRKEKERPEDQGKDQEEMEYSDSDEDDGEEERPRFRRIPTKSPSEYRLVNDKGTPEVIRPRSLVLLTKQAERTVRPFDPSFDVSNWIHHFKDITQNLPEIEQFGILRAKLSAGPTFDWFVSRHREMKHMDVERWLLLLEASFASDPLRRKNALRGRKQREGEDAAEYVREIDTLCIRYMPNMSVLDKIGYIADNVHPKYAHEFARISTHDRTLVDVELSLRNAMKLAGTTGSRPANSGGFTFPVGQGKSTERAATFQATQKAPEEEYDPVVGPGYDHYGSTANFAAAPAPAAQARSEKQETSGYSQKQPNPKTGGGDRRETRKCFGCGKIGHIQADCWNSPKGRGGGGGRGNNSKGPPPYCTYCNKNWHTADDCYKKAADDKRKEVKTEPTAANGQNPENSA